VSDEGVVFLLMVLSFDACVGVFRERSLRPGGGRVGVDEGWMTVVGEIWTRMNVCFLWMNSKRCT